MPSISTIAITYNEEANIERCLKSVAPFSDEIVVVDSMSTDRTVELARPLATRIVQHEWLGYGKQKQFALEHVTQPWVFSIDADEEVSPELCNEILALDFSRAAYDMPRKVWYLNRWITHSGWYPGYIVRLFDRARGRFTDQRVHEFVDIDGAIGRLKGDLYHYSYRDVAHHIEKMNDFTTLSARDMNDAGRRASLLSLSIIPGLEFLKVYVQKRGFLDGLAGLTISMLHSIYVFLKYAKLYELNHGGSVAGAPFIPGGRPDGEPKNSDHKAESVEEG